MVDTLVQAIREGRGVLDAGFVLLNSKLEPEELSHDQISSQAERRGRDLRSLGLQKGDRVGLILPENKDFVLWFLGAVTAGIVPVPLYPPMPVGRIEGYIERATGILRECEARMVITSKYALPPIETLLTGVSSLERFVITEEVSTSTEQEGSSRADEIGIEPSDICFVQFTSGSTTDPKGVVVSHANVVANARGLLDAVSADADKGIVVSWLPLYHDMGLMLMMAPVIVHARVVFMSPITFVTRPNSWLETVHKYRATFTAAPNFGLGLAAKFADSLGKVDLSCLRVIVCGAESVNPNTVRRFVETFRPAGLKPTAVTPAYGLAEATLCVTHSAPDAPMRTVLVDRESYEKSGQIKRIDGDAQSQVVEIVSCGRPLPRHQVAIMMQDGTLAPDGEVGEIVISGPSVTRGYFQNPAATGKLFAGGWLLTGDLGFILDGELYVSGRKKDLIIVAGRNYHPQSVEWCVERIPGIRAGNVVAFSVSDESGEKVVIVAECKEAAQIPELTGALKTLVAADIGINVKDVVFVEKGSLPKTSSGKLQRGKTKIAYVSAGLKRIGC